MYKLLTIYLKSGHKIKIICKDFKFDNDRGKITGYNITESSIEFEVNIDSIEAYGAYTIKTSESAINSFIIQQANDFLGGNFKEKDEEEDGS